MTDLASITGKALIDRQVFIRLLSKLEPTALDENSTQYHIGYENAKKDMLDVLAVSLGPEFSTPMSVRLIRELRRDKGS